MFSSLVFHLLVIIAFVEADVGRLILIRNPPPLDVGIGMNVALSNRHLVIQNKAMNGDLCRVEVDDSEPASLMVGRLEPKKFDCFFKDGEVVYHHEGSPLTTQDRIKFTIYYFWRNNSVVETVFVNVRINPSPDFKVFDPRADIEVKTSKAISTPISSNILRFRYDPVTERCTVRYASLRARGRRGDRGPWLATRKWPAIGRVVDYRKRVVNSFEHDCQEMLLMGYRYEHRKPGSPDVDFIPLSVRVQQKGGPPFKERRENLFLKIVVRNAAPNNPPKLRARSVKMTNNGGTLEPIPTDAISLSKDESRSRFLILNVTSFSGSAPAQLVNMRDPSKGISSFTYSDFKERKIRFQILAFSDNSTKRYQIGLQAIDGYLARSPVRYLRIASSLLGNGPCQYFNIPITTYSRATTKVMTHNFQVLGNPRCRTQGLRYSIRDEPASGGLMVDGEYAKTFSPQQIDGVGVVYKPRNFAAEADSMKVEAISVDDRAKLNVPIHIVKLHDRRSALKPRSEWTVNSKGSVCFGVEMVDRGSAWLLLRDNVDLRFKIETQPQQGFLVRTVGLTPREAPSIKPLFFTFEDLRLRRICYRHQGWNGDRFLVRQMVQSIPIRLPVTTVVIRANSEPITVLRDESEWNATLEVKETTNSAKLTSRFLRYRAPNVHPDKVRFTVTLFPRFRDANETVDAGRLVNVKDMIQIANNGDMPTKSVIKDLKKAQIGTVSEFSQLQVDQGFIVYVPPLEDIGVTDRDVFLTYRVTTNAGHQLANRTLTIRVKAEDDKPPQVESDLIDVKRGSSHAFSSQEIHVTDIDTQPRDVMVEVRKLPLHGHLIDDQGRRMLTGYRFPATAIAEGKIKYKNDGKNYKSDSFNLTVSDGPRVSNVSVVRLNITDYDWNVGAWKAYVNNSIQVQENSSVVILEAVFPHPAPSDNVRSDADVLYYIYENPVKGQIMMGDGVVSQFTLQDVRRKLIRYNHTSGEIGAVTVYDFARVSLYLRGEPRGYRKINFSINPVNSQAPQIFIGSSLIITEGRKTHAIVGYNILAAVDRDTVESRVRIRVLQRPMWGEIKVNGRPSYDFTMAQVREGHVWYVQSPKAQGLEETKDRFSVVASDGQFSSAESQVNVDIILGNDEAPRLVLNDFSVKRGGKKVLGSSILSVSDADIPQDSVLIRISRKPRKGDLFFVYRNTRERRRVTGNLNVFSLNRMKTMDLVYEHNKTSKGFKDSFEVTVTDQVHVVRKRCNIRVVGKNELPPMMMPAEPLFIRKDVIGKLTESQLNAVDGDTPPGSLVYTLLSAPEKGQVVRVGDVNFLPRSAFPSKKNASGISIFSPKLPIEEGKTFTQEEVNRGKIAYMYLGRSRERVRDTFIVQLSDGRVTLPPRSIVAVCDNPPPNKPMAMTARVLRVQRQGQVTLRPDDLRIENSLTPVDRLQVEVAQMSRCGSLIDTKATQPVSLTSFLYNELHDDRILLKVDDCPPDVKELAITLAVQDMGMRADTLLRVMISRPPVVTRFMRLTVKQASRATIGPEILKTHDPDTPPSRLVYVVVHAPERGVLVKHGSEVMRGENFTQADVNERRIAYHNLKGPGSDSIGLNVTDGDSSSYVFARRPGRQGVVSLQVKIVPVAKKLVSVNNVSPTKLEDFGWLGYGFRFSERNIQSNYPNATRYVITRQPTFGRLQLQSRPRSPVTSFTAENLKSRSLLYLMKPRSKVMTNDSFAYRLQVQNETMRGGEYKTNGKVYQMDLVWSKVQFIKKRYRICEGKGTLKIRVLRVGFLKANAYVRVNYQSKGARMPRDFLPSTDRDIEFKDGQKESIYRVKINVERKDRRSGKKKKKVIFSLNSNSNALLGDLSRTTVVIKEGKRCRQDPDFITPEQEREEMRLEAEKKRKSQGAVRSQDDRHMLQDIRIPSDEELRKQALKQQNLLIPDLPSSEELKKYEEHHVSFKDLSQVPHDDTTPDMPCGLTTMAFITEYKGKKFICDGLQEKWIPLDEVNKETPMPRCERGWIANNNRCYRFFDVPMAWTGAKASCEEHNAILAAPASMEKQKWITETVSRKNKFWIGLHFDYVEKIWRYTDFSKPNFTRWGRKAPSLRHLSRRRGSRRCVVVTPAFTWRARRCSGSRHLFGFVCEKAAT